MDTSKIERSVLRNHDARHLQSHALAEGPPRQEIKDKSHRWHVDLWTNADGVEVKREGIWPAPTSLCIGGRAWDNTQNSSSHQRVSEEAPRRLTVPNRCCIPPIGSSWFDMKGCAFGVSGIRPKTGTVRGHTPRGDLKLLTFRGRCRSFNY
jgi:hypothetical protein